MSQRDEARAEILWAVGNHCSHEGEPLPEPAEPCPSCSLIATEVLERIDTVARLLGYVREDDGPAPCNMTHTPPFDFAQCETHDTTFALGDKCKFDGRDMLDVYADEAQEQRARAVRAEMERDRALEALHTTKETP